MITNKKKSKKSRKAKLVENGKTRPTGWNTTDDDEIKQRQLRGQEEKIKFKNNEPHHDYFGSFEVSSQQGANYRVEIRSLVECINSCDCMDYRTNGLGTCKHIEHILFCLQKRRKKKFKKIGLEGSSRVEIYLDRRDGDIIRVSWPQKPPSAARQLIARFFLPDGKLVSDSVDTFLNVQRVILAAKPSIKNKVRLSHHIDDFIKNKRRFLERQASKDAYLTDLKQGKGIVDLVKIPLYSYQTEGMMHLVFTERALLADEMGLGKTVQAVAACNLLRKLKNIQKVLVIATASLKAEWEEQIAKFTDLPSLIIQGSRARRLELYQRPAFFYLTNYEQILIDGPDIQGLVNPDVIILDEAQRIKNWQTKTSNAVKKLTSRYAFVLTGTPLENKIDDIYSVIQFLDPHVFGALFRFNRYFYELDEDSGKPIAYKNLDELHRRLRPVMLRRRKDDVEGELPERTVNNYFVKMDAEQRSRYLEYQERVARIMSIAKRRSLRKEEFEKLMKWLSCMRMLCDTPYILDPKCRISPKLHELENILEELLTDDTVKIIIFSEWERMLQLVRELAQKMRIKVAWHTGSVAQHKRREEINRFKGNADCRLFLSTDSGSVGLNLQTANVVINLDLPWNPAKLEQRIARAWRKHQTRTVTVINLVSEDSIEHRMLALLAQKQVLAQGVLEGKDDLKTMELPSGRAAFMERMESLMGSSSTPAVVEIANTVPAEEEFVPDSDATTLQEITTESVAIVDYVDLLQVHHHPETGQQTAFAVVSEDINQTRERIQETLQTMHGDGIAGLEILDRNTFDIIQRLVQAGILTINQHAKTLHASQTFSESKKQLLEKQIIKARKHLTQAERKHRMADILINGEFTEEAVAPLREAIMSTLHSFALLNSTEMASEKEIISPEFVKEQLIEQYGLPKKTLSLLHSLRNAADHTQVPILFADSQEIFQHVDAALKKMALG